MSLPTEKIEFKQARDFGEVFNTSILFVKENFKPLFFGLLLIAGPFVLVGSVLPILINLKLTSGGFNIGMENSDFLYQLGASTLVNVASSLIGGVMVVGVVYEYILLYMEGDLPVIRTSDLWKAIRSDFFQLLGNMVGTFLAYIFGLGILSFILFSLFAQMGIFITVIGFLVLMGVWVYSYVPISLVLILNLHERVGLFNAIYRCFVLIKGHWWETFGLLVVCAIFMFGISLVSLIPLSLFTYSTDLLTNPGSSLSITVVIGLLTGIMFTLATVLVFGLYLTITAFQYFNLLERKDSTGLLERIQNIGTPEPISKKTDFYENEEETY
jgi:hypothetical protein